VAAFGLVVLAVIYFLYSRSHKSKPIDPPDDPNVIANPADFTANGAASNASAQAASRAPEMPELDRARADTIREQLRELPPLPRAASNSTTPGQRGNYPVMPDDPDSSATLSQYIRSRIKEDYVPLARSCYKNALEKNPDLGGRVVMKFRIGGDRRVGGVVESAEVDPATTMQDDPFLECVKESMMAVSFDAPPNDGHVDVVYPLVFASTDGGDRD
jgi:hypothetical protein